MNDVLVRQVEVGEEPALRHIFYCAVHQICARDYYQSQLEAWAPTEFNSTAWTERIQRNKPFVAVAAEEVIGFADLQPSGYIDQFFIVPEWTGRGIAKSLMAHLEETAKAQSIRMLSSNVSITAEPFFKRCGFWTESSQVVNLSGVSLTNYKMRKEIY